MPQPPQVLSVVPAQGGEEQEGGVADALGLQRWAGNVLLEAVIMRMEGVLL
jgi:hypothetical protein